MKKYYIPFVLSVLVSCSSGKHLMTEINVIDENENPIPLAHLTIQNAGTKINIKTDINGYVKIVGLNSGTYKIDASALGFYKLSGCAIEFKNEKELLRIQMIPSINNKDTNVEWSGGWTTFLDSNGQIISIRGK